MARQTVDIPRPQHTCPRAILVLAFLCAAGSCSKNNNRPPILLQRPDPDASLSKVPSSSALSGPASPREDGSLIPEPPGLVRLVSLTREAKGWRVVLLETRKGKEPTYHLTMRSVTERKLGTTQPSLPI